MSLPHNFHLVYNSIALLPVPVLFLSCTRGRNSYRSHFFRAPAIRQAGMPVPQTRSASVRALLW